MGISNKATIRLTAVLAILLWLVLVFADSMLFFSDLKKLPAGIPHWTSRVLFNIYCLLVYVHLVFRIEKNENLSFNDLLWQVFSVGIISTLTSLGFPFLLSTLPGGRLTNNPLVVEFIYEVNLTLFVNVLITAFVVWKKLIMYQKRKWIVRLWSFFQALLLITMVLDIVYGYLPKQTGAVVIVLVILLTIVIASNVRWIAYLNIKQKWTGLLLLLLVAVYMSYFGFLISQYTDSVFQMNIRHSPLSIGIFNISLFVFVCIYTIFSFLVILFNLPTSSVFEQKLEETVNFQRISQSIQTEQSEESVYNILLETSVSTVFADAGWLQIADKNGLIKRYEYQITESEVLTLEELLRKSAGISTEELAKKKWQYAKSLKDSHFKSALCFSITVQDKPVGMMTLLKELPNSFNKEMIQIVFTFANQASISIENFRLMEEAFQNERYKEELKIAREVQKNLLPKKLDSDPSFDIITFSQSADEVGGDYFDALRLSDDEVAIIIADVSGKGTSAAFHMSQMKGIFHSLAQLRFDPKHFMTTANMALRNCLERSSFISAIYFIINTAKKKIIYARAGHCPILYYKAQTKQAGYFEDKGMALGMVRNISYANSVHVYEFNYNSGDIMVLYTDGITEAHNSQGEEFGKERLAACLRQIPHKSPKEIESHIFERLYEFSETRYLKDDYTTMIIKFT